MSGRNTSHLERTAQEPRQSELHAVTVRKIENVNHQVRLFRLELSSHGVKFCAGQWLDVHVPDIPKAGGFTMTSPPSAAKSPGASGMPYLELAVQDSPSNAVAAWLWKPEEDILGSTLQVRIGGSFIFPPREWPATWIDGSTGTQGQNAATPSDKITRIVFVAGGVGVNPLVSMLSHLAESLEFARKPELFVADVLYTSKPPLEDSGEVLFMGRISRLFADKKLVGSVRLYNTGDPAASALEQPKHPWRLREPDTHALGGAALHVKRGRLHSQELVNIVRGTKDEGQGQIPEASLVYICGPPGMTDGFVAALTGPSGARMDSGQVKTEKWW